MSAAAMAEPVLTRFVQHGRKIVAIGRNFR